jgi:hypothetical protein
MEFNGSNTIVYKAAEALSDRFKEAIYEFKMLQIRRAERRSRTNLNSESGALLLKRTHDELLSSLIPSSATLLVVPSTLLKHWEVRFHLLYWTVNYHTPLPSKFFIPPKRSKLRRM